MATVRSSRTYDASLDAFLAMLRDPAATEAKYAGMGHEQIEIVECRGDDTEIRVESTRVVTVDLPGFAKKVLQPTNRMHQTDTWTARPDGSWTGSFEVEVHGAPIRLNGTLELVGHGATTEQTVTIDVQVKVPLIGGKIADWAANNDVRHTLDAEFDHNGRWLAEHA